MLLVIDNYDSFVHNLARLLRRSGAETTVVRNDVIDVAAVRELNPAAIVFSPGPLTPAEAGTSLDIVRELSSEIPMLGVCLGHQTIASAFGAHLCQTDPMHGRASTIQHAGTGLFAGLPTPLRVGRYHSLIIDAVTLPQVFDVTATTEDGTIMAIAHRELPMHAVQFHPESVLTEHGEQLLQNFVRLAKAWTPPT